MNGPLLYSALLCWLVAVMDAGAGDGNVQGTEPPKSGGTHLKYEAPQYLTGAIYAPVNKQLLFKFTRTATRDGSTLKIARDFTYPDGKLAARERVVYEVDELVSFELVESQTGATGSAKIRRAPDHPFKGTVDFAFAGQAGARVKSSTEGPHWDELMRGDKVKCRYVVVPRRETVGFTFVKESESTWQGREVLTVRMEPSSLLVEALVAPLFFTIEKAPPHHVLQYVGRTSLKIRVGGKWKDLDAVSVFDWGSAR